MIAAYESGDPYLAFCKQTGLAPADATKETHPEIRAAGKVVQLGRLFGLEAQGIADKIGRPIEDGRRLLELHRRTYPRFWQWSAGAVDRAMLTGVITTTFGWPLRVGGERPNPRTIRNLPMQGNGAEMMRLAAIRATEAGLQIAAPVHDGFLLLRRLIASTITSIGCARRWPGPAGRCLPAMRSGRGSSRWFGTRTTSGSTIRFGIASWGRWGGSKNGKYHQWAFQMTKCPPVQVSSKTLRILEL